MKTQKNNFRNILPCLIYGCLCGALTGAVIFFFKFAASHAESLSRYLYRAARSSPLLVILTFVCLVSAALIMTVLHKYIPESKGGGIPRSEGVLRGLLPFKWLRTFFGAVIGSMISFFCGLPLGCEGPSVLIGTSVGGMCVSGSKNKNALARYVMTGGAGAGFAVATGAPLSGVLFALEEIHKRFTPMLVMTVSVSVVSATFVNRALCEFFGLSHTLLSVSISDSFTLGTIPYLLLLGIIIALAVLSYDASISLVSKLTSKFKRYLTAPVKIIAVFVITGVLGFVFTDGVYNGHHVITSLIHENIGAAFILLMLAVRFIMMLLSTDSGVTGGTFIPTLAIGALVAALTSKLLLVMGLPNELMSSVIILGMCAFIGGTLRAPLTAAVLFIELTGQFTDIFFIVLVIFTVNAITELVHLTPFYDIALENMVEEHIGGRKAVTAHFEAKISPDSFVVGKSVRDVMWPNSTVVVSIRHYNEKTEDTSNDGEKKMYAGDTVVLRALYYDEDELVSLLSSLLGKDSDIHKMV